MCLVSPLPSKAVATFEPLPAGYYLTVNVHYCWYRCTARNNMPIFQPTQDYTVLASFDAEMVRDIK